MLRVERAKVGRYLWPASWGWRRKQQSLQTYWRGRRIKNQKGGIPKEATAQQAPSPHCRSHRSSYPHLHLAHSATHGLLRLALSQ